MQRGRAVSLSAVAVLLPLRWFLRFCCGGIVFRFLLVVRDSDRGVTRIESVILCIYSRTLERPCAACSAIHAIPPILCRHEFSPFMAKESVPAQRFAQG